MIEMSADLRMLSRRVMIYLILLYKARIHRVYLRHLYDVFSLVLCRIIEYHSRFGLAHVVDILRI